MNTVTIGAEPFAVELDLDETALLVIDMQKDFLYPGGFGAFLGNDVTLLQRTIEPLQAVLAAARKLEMLIIHTREGHLPDLSDCPPAKLDRWSPGTRIGDIGPMGRILIRGEEGHGIIVEVAPLPGEIVLDKPGKNSFYATNLDQILRAHPVKNLIVTGVTTDVCVFTTTTGANDHGYNAIVLADCVASYSPARHTAALETIKAQGGIFGWVSDSQRFLASVAQLQ
jgi:nicotinamidase-related amidase